MPCSAALAMAQEIATRSAVTSSSRSRARTLDSRADSGTLAGSFSVQVKVLNVLRSHAAGALRRDLVWFGMVMSNRVVIGRDVPLGLGCQQLLKVVLFVFQQFLVLAGLWFVKLCRMVVLLGSNFAVNRFTLGLIRPKLWK
jgi:hypothetical protein